METGTAASTSPAPRLADALDRVGIRYIGLKKKKTDNVCNTDIEWDGFGDVQMVPKVLAPKFLSPRYRAVWQSEHDQIPEHQTDADVRAKAVANAKAAVAAHKIEVERKTPAAQETSFDKLDEDRVMAGIGDLLDLPDQSKTFDLDGKPNIEALRAVLGKKISPLARDQAWDLIQSAKARS